MLFSDIHIILHYFSQVLIYSRYPHTAPRYPFTGHYYANPTNRFWPLLRKTGIVPDDFGAEDDDRCLSIGIGFTDVRCCAARQCFCCSSKIRIRKSSSLL